MGSVSGLGMAGPLAVFAPGFSAELVRQGYRPGSAAAQLRVDGGRERVAGRSRFGGW